MQAKARIIHVYIYVYHPALHGSWDKLAIIAQSAAAATAIYKYI